MAGRNKKVPWFENMSPEEFSEWATDDPESFKAYLDKKFAEYNEIKSQLQPNEPHPLEFEDGAEDPRYQSRIRIWENEVALDRAESKRQMAQSPHAPIPRTLKALMEGNPEEKGRAAEVSKLKTLVNDQIIKANRAESMGRTKDAWEFRDRAATFAREVERLEGEKYTFEVEADSEALKTAETELSEAMNWTPEQVKEKRNHLEGLVQGFRNMSETEYSFVIDDKGKVLKLNHPNIPACHIENKIGTTRSEVLIRKLGVHGIEGREEEPAPKENKGLPPISEMTEAEFQKYQKEAQEKRKPIPLTSIEVAPGLFPPRR